MATFILEAADGPALNVRRVPPDAHWGWLGAGWADFRSGWRATLPVGIAVALVSALIVFFMWRAGLEAFIPAACGGFAIVGPALAVGVYDVSRKLDAGQPVDVMTALRPQVAAPGQLAMLGFALLFVLLVWARLATLIYALASGTLDTPVGGDFVRFVLETPQGLIMLGVGSAVGAALAFVAFAISVVSVPLVARRQVDAMTAMVISCVAVAKNPGAMLSWAFNIAILVAICIATGFLALAVVFPWLGHATWRAYRAVIDDGL